MVILTNDLPVAVLTAATAFLVSGIAGAFSLLGLLITKEQKVSEFRQAWIDALRSDLAAFIARVCIVQAHIEMASNAAELLRGTRDDFLELNAASMRIKLRLNPIEAESLPILESMKELEKTMNSDIADIKDAHDRIKSALNKLERNAPMLLKAEWKRVKRGEPIYRVAKMFAGLVLLGTGGAAIWLFATLLR